MKESKSIANIITLRADFEAKVALVNEALKANEAVNSITDLEADMEKARKELNKVERDTAFAALRSAENTMLATIEQLTYAVTVAKKQTDKDTKAVSYEIGKKNVRINAASLEDWCKEQIGVKPGWRYLADDLARYLAARKAKEIGADWKKVCNDYKLRTQTERTEIKDPTSMNTLIERLQNLVDAMYFKPYEKDEKKNAYKVTSKDVGFVLGRAYGESKQLLTVATLKKSMDSMLLIALEVLNHLVFENEYKVEYKAK